MNLFFECKADDLINHHSGVGDNINKSKKIECEEKLGVVMFGENHFVDSKRSKNSKEEQLYTGDGNLDVSIEANEHW
jgi:hypothetical protein